MDGAPLFGYKFVSGSLPAACGGVGWMVGFSVPVCSLDQTRALSVNEKETCLPPVQLLRSLAPAFSLVEISSDFPSTPGKLAAKLEAQVLFPVWHDGLVIKPS